MLATINCLRSLVVLIAKSAKYYGNSTFAKRHQYFASQISTFRMRRLGSTLDILQKPDNQSFGTCCLFIEITLPFDSCSCCKESHSRNLAGNVVSVSVPSKTEQNKGNERLGYYKVELNVDSHSSKGAYTERESNIAKIKRSKLFLVTQIFRL